MCWHTWDIDTCMNTEDAEHLPQLCASLCRTASILFAFSQEEAKEKATEERVTWQQVKWTWVAERKNIVNLNEVDVLGVRPAPRQPSYNFFGGWFFQVRWMKL